jgi:hypothetical protein
MSSSRFVIVAHAPSKLAPSGHRAHAARRLEGAGVPVVLGQTAGVAMGWLRTPSRWSNGSRWDRGDEVGGFLACDYVRPAGFLRTPANKLRMRSQIRLSRDGLEIWRTCASVSGALMKTPGSGGMLVSSGG